MRDFILSLHLALFCGSYSKYVICEGKFRRTCNRCLGFENWNVAELNVSRAVNYHEMSHIDARFRSVKHVRKTIYEFTHRGLIILSTGCLSKGKSSRLCRERSMKLVVKLFRGEITFVLRLRDAEDKN